MILRVVSVYSKLPEWVAWSSILPTVPIVSKFVRENGWIGREMGQEDEANAHSRRSFSRSRDRR